jgi:hypothetical protein
VVLRHHDLCFACGRTNLFGLLLELEPSGPGAVAGRCFIKQDHQGPDPGTAHEGVITAALSDAISLARGQHARARALEVQFLAPAPVGAFLDIEALADPPNATASHDGLTVARARGTYDS